MALDVVMLVIGEWTVHPEFDRLSRQDETRHIAPRATDVLVYMARRRGELVTKDELLDAFWRGAISGDNAVHKTVAELRRALDDDPHSPEYIQTHPKRGYRLIAEVAPGQKPIPARTTVVPASGQVVAVLPFVNMINEPALRHFGQGLAEEIINRLGAGHPLQVVSHSVTFGVHSPYGDPRDLGTQLGCSLILEGSVRRYERQLRTNASLIDCGSGLKVWGRSLDHHVDNPITLQDTLAQILTINVCEHLGLIEKTPFSPTPDQSYLKAIFEDETP